MIDAGLIGTLLFLLNGLFTYKAFTDKAYMDRYIFDIDKILIDKQYDRLLTSGFLHLNWFHFAFNMGALLAFSFSLERHLGIANFLIIYFVSLLGGNLLSLYIHRNHGDYRALGASGAICGVILASVILFPEHSIGIPFSEASMPSWVFALLFVGISIIGIKKSLGNIGHDAHLGGALCGVLMTIALHPKILANNWWIVLIIIVPTAAFLILMIKKPQIMMIEDDWGIDLRQNINDIRHQKSQSTKEKTTYTMDYLLDKIKREGLESLTKKERQTLDELKDKL